MATKSTPRVRMPSTAKAGEIVEVKTLISHDMETGLRKDAQGNPIARKIIKEFFVTFNGVTLFRSNWYSAVAANPYLAFWVRISEPGTFEFNWVDDDGSVYKAEQTVSVG